MTAGSESRRRWRWIVLVGLIVFALFVAFVVGRRTPKEQSARPSASAPLKLDTRRLDSRDESAPKHPDPGPGPRRPPAGRRVTDNLCGMSESDQVRNDGETVEQHVARVTEKTIGGWRTALLESGDLRQRAVGLALGNAKPISGSLTFAAPDSAAKNDLVLLAIETNDPAIYALALGQCGENNLTMAVGPCQGLSLEHWAQIDPDNAVPWMWLASRADSMVDRVRADEALSRAANASRLDSYVGAMSALALGALPPQVAPLEKAVAGADLISISRLVTPVALVANLCSEQALQVAARKQQCSSIANLLATQGSSIFEVVMAAILGKRLGWPEEKWMPLQKESDSYRHAPVYPWSSAESGDRGFRCPKVLKYDYFIDQLAAHGGSERAAMKATIEAPRKPF